METPEEELEWLSKDWKSVAYTFFKPEVTVESDASGKCVHIFYCMNRGCRMKISRWLDKGDAKSTGNLRKHIKVCWGDEALAAADEMKNADDARPCVAKFAHSGSVTASFECKGKGKITYSTRQHTRQQSRAEIVRWVSESLHPFAIVEDRGFHSLMKMGRPEY
ncbi:hypothetical protein BKA93DRAFT_821897 [Sparassis latifolia]